MSLYNMQVNRSVFLKPTLPPEVQQQCLPDVVEVQGVLARPVNGVGRSVRPARGRWPPVVPSSDLSGSSRPRWHGEPIVLHDAPATPEPRLPSAPSPLAAPSSWYIHGVLFTSCFQGDAHAETLVSESGGQFLAKPFTLGLLALKVRDALDSNKCGS